MAPLEAVRSGFAAHVERTAELERPGASASGKAPAPRSLRVDSFKTDTSAPKASVHFADSLSLSSYKPSSRIRPTTDTKTSRFDWTVRQALSQYSVEGDAGFQAARRSERDARNGALPAHGDPAVDRALQQFRIAPGQRALLSRAAAMQVGPAKEPLIRPVQAMAVAETLQRLRPEVAGQVNQLLGRASDELERAVLLKMVSPRANDLLSENNAVRGRALSEVQRFADVLRGAPRSLILERSSILSKDPDGTLRTFRQQHDNTCVAASVLECLSSADPFLLWALKADGPVHERRPTGLAAKLERAILTSNISGQSLAPLTDTLVRASGRTPEEARRMLRERGETWDLPQRPPVNLPGHVDAWVEAKVINKADARELLKLWEPKATLKALGMPDFQINTREQYRRFQSVVRNADRAFPKAAQALDKVKATWGTAPFTVGQILEWGQAGLQQPRGIGPEYAAKLFLSPKTHLGYNRVKFLYRLPGDAQHSERLAQVLNAGQPVLIRRGNPEDLETDYSHCITALLARGKPGQREFLIPDTWTGTARWVPQKDFESRRARISYYFGHSFPVRGVGRLAKGRPAL
jgi:hypothetical protein